MRNQYFVSIVFIFTSAILLTTKDTKAATYRDVTGVQPGHVAWIYGQPNVSSPRVGYLKAGALRVRTMSCKHLAAGGWCHVIRRGTRGWVQDRYLKAGNIMRG